MFLPVLFVFFLHVSMIREQAKLSALGRKLYEKKYYVREVEIQFTFQNWSSRMMYTRCIFGSSDH